MDISWLDLAEFIVCDASVGLGMHLLLVVARLEGREDEIPIVHNLKTSHIQIYQKVFYIFGL